MKDIVHFFDEMPLILKIILALPFIDGIAWGIYRIAKGIDENNAVLFIAGIIWIIFGFFLFWVLDLVAIIIKGRPTILA